MEVEILTKRNNRGLNPSQANQKILIAMAGGRCQFKGCGKKLFQNEDTLTKGNFSNMAHIIASSPDGPRGNEESHDLSADINNIILLCPQHHKEVDTHKEKYPADVLKEMKVYQEKKVDELLNGLCYSTMERIQFTSPIKGTSKVAIDDYLTIEALRSINRNPSHPEPIKIDIESTGGYGSKNYWKNSVDQLMNKYKTIIRPYFNHPDTAFAIFPIAPIPLIAKLGELFGDKVPVEIFQKFRTPNTWEWRSKERCNSFTLERLTRADGNIFKVAIILSLTSEIAEERVLKVYNPGIIYVLHADKIGVDCISSLEDLSAFWHKYQEICDRIKNKDQLSEAAVFPAVPVSAAFEIGRRYMPGAYPILTLYDEDDGFFETLKIGGKSDE